MMNFIENQIGTFAFLIGLGYMLFVTLAKTVFDTDREGETTLLANTTMVTTMFLVAVIVYLLNEPYLFIWKAFIAISCVRFWYVIGLWWIEAAYTWIVEVLLIAIWKIILSIKNFFIRIRDFFKRLFAIE